MKITIYTVSSCPFSKAEKDYLVGKGFAFEEKNLETNRDFLTEMLSVSNNFAGTPVTRIEKDDGQIVVLKGFTQSEFDQTLMPTVQFQQRPSDQPQAPNPLPPPVPEPPSPPPPEPPKPPMPEPTPPPPPVAQEPVSTPAPEPPKTTAVPAAHDDALDSILKDLQHRVNQAYSPSDQSQSSQKQPVDMPKEPPTPQTPNPTPPPPPTPVTPEPTPPTTPSVPTPNPTVPEVPNFPSK